MLFTNHKTFVCIYMENVIEKQDQGSRLVNALWLRAALRLGISMARLRKFSQNISCKGLTIESAVRAFIHCYFTHWSSGKVSHLLFN